MPSSSTFRVFETAEEVARAGAEQFVTLANDAVADHNGFSAALAGGSTPRLMYQLLSSESFRSRINWRTVDLFFGDERSVPRDHPDSNYRMVYETLISHINIPASNVHPINGEGETAENARVYEEELRGYFPGLRHPRFDLILLGLGEDGHTASLFPYSTALAEKRAWVIENWVEKLRAFRLTLTAASINAAANVTFMVTGTEKAPALSEVLFGPKDFERLPAQLIKPEAGVLTWLVDAAAAAHLPADIGSSAVHVSERPENDNKDQNG